ncbi:26S protease regulatory subunit 6A, partial [Durusdinium trenchii]
RLFGQLDPLSSGALPRQRFESVAGTVTLSGLRLFLAEVASDRPELLARADIDQGGSLSRAEFLSLTQLLGLTTLNGEELFGLLNYSSTELDQTLQVVLGDVTLVHLRLLALCEFGPDSALAPADEDASDTVDLQEFHHFAGGYLAVSNASNVENLFIALDVSRRGA